MSEQKTTQPRQATAKPAPKPLSTIRRRDVRTAVAKTRGW